MAKYTIGNFPRDKVSPDAAAMLDHLTERGWGNVGINSAGRSKAHNRAVGGVKGSLHTKGKAFDFDIGDLSGRQQQAFGEDAAEGGGNEVGLYDDGHMHVGVGKSRPSVFAKGVRMPGWLKGLGTALKQGEIRAIPAAMAFPERPPVPEQRPEVLPGPVNLPTPALGGEVSALNRAPTPATPQQAIAAALNVPTPSPSPAPVPDRFGAPAPISQPEVATSDIPDVSKFDAVAARARQGGIMSPAGPYASVAPASPATAPVSQPGPGGAVPNAPAPSLSPQMMSPNLSTNVAPSLGPNPATGPISPTLTSPTGSIANPADANAIDPMSTDVLPAGPQTQTNPLPPTPPPAPTATPAPTPAAPPLTQRPPVQDYPVATPQLQPAQALPDVPAPPAAPRAPTIGMDPQGVRTVTNQYGVTTGMTPGGYQTAYGNGPELGNLGHITSAIGEAMKAPTSALAQFGVKDGMNGSRVGKLVGGGIGLAATKSVLGAAIGGWIGGAIGSAYDKTKFPDKPETNAKDKGNKGFDRARADAISPAASRAISAGKAGLY